MTTRKLNIVLLAVALLVSGCAMTPRQRLYNARQAYTAALNALVIAQQDGLIDAKAHDAIEPYRAAAAVALDAWDKALIAGQPTAEAQSSFSNAIARLKQAYLAIKEASHGH